MGVASLVLGIVSIVGAVIGFTLPALIIAIVGIVLGVMAKKKDPNDGKAKAGFVCSVIGCVLAAIVFIACAACIGSASSLVSSLS